MNLVVAQQVALDNALVAPEKRLKIEKCNARIKFSKPQRETTYQVTLDSLKLSPCYPAFLITVEVPEICLRLPNQDFVEPPSEEDMVPFIKELGYASKCDMLSEIHTDHMHQPWRTFAAIINKCISGKSTSLDRLRPSSAQILWGMFYQKNVDYAALLINLYTVRDDSLLEKLNTVLEEEPAHKPKRAKKPEPAKQAKTTKKTTRVKKSSTMQTAGVVIRDTPAVQLEKVLKKSKQDTHMLQASSSIQSKSENESWGDSEDDDDSDVDDNENNSDDDGNNEQSDDDHEQADGEQIESDDEKEK
ncbi:hypothetical protein Tco_1300588 [Tanacetum coccineum]